MKRLNAVNFRLSYSHLKKKALENMSKLEEYGIVTKENKYQDMLNSLAEVSIIA